MNLLQFCETIHKNIFMKRTADELNETQIHSLPAGGTSSLSLVSGVNKAALMNFNMRKCENKNTI